MKIPSEYCSKIFKILKSSKYKTLTSSDVRLLIDNCCSEIKDVYNDDNKMNVVYLKFQNNSNSLFNLQSHLYRYNFHFIFIHHL